MKKLFLSLVAVMIAATSTFAQSSMLATLSHEGQISTYYGPMALREAYDAADNGDVITLSSGSFNAVDIKKGLTIRGAGMEVDTISHSEPTILTGGFKIQIPDSISRRLTIEGIYSNHRIEYVGTLKNATFMKSRMREITYNSNSASLLNAIFVHCRIAEYASLGNNSSASFLNCIISGPYCLNDKSSNFDCTNCVILNRNSWNYFHSSLLKNCILVANVENSIPSTTSVFNCVCISNSINSPIFKYITNNTNWSRNRATDNQFFKSGNCEYSDSETFELPIERQTRFLGLDGTQVGIYGGNMPFSSTPTNPQITKCNVAAKSTADGKLSVDITVNGAE